MNIETCLIEIGIEEIPARFQKSLIEDFSHGIVSRLEKSRFSFSSHKTFITPRRFGLIFKDIASISQTTSERKLGPFVAQATLEDGSPSLVGSKFAESCGVDFADLQSFDTPKGKKLGLEKKQPRVALEAVLLGFVEETLRSLHLPESMRWENQALAFIRPIRSLCLMLDDRLLKGKVLGLEVSSWCSLHRQRVPVQLSHAGDYEQQAHKGCVVICPETRKKAILEQMRDLESARGFVVEQDEELLDEVVGLVEFPRLLVCPYPEKFLSLPKELLKLVMAQKQRYFLISNTSGEVLPYFVVVSNLVGERTDLVIKGNQRVVVPRLEDGAFFIEQDNKKGLEFYATKLDRVQFVRGLGSLLDKQQRVTKLLAQLPLEVSQKQQALQKICPFLKADLLTLLVQEFPELQGLAGKYYAQEQFGLATADLLNEQYLPRFAGDSLPQSELGIALSFCDRLDSLVGFARLGNLPKSNDPFALRRSAIGLLRLVFETPLCSKLDFMALCASLDELYNQQAIEPKHADWLQKLTAFLHERLLHILPKDQFRLLQAYNQNVFANLSVFVSWLQQHQASPYPESFWQSFSNIAKRFQKLARGEAINFDASLATSDIEKQALEDGLVLVSEVDKLETDLGAFYAIWSPRLEMLGNFLDSVHIQVEDQELRSNRQAFVNLVAQEIVRHFRGF